ncbi:hypothetical protein JMZ96_16755 [Bacillus cereus]
MQKNLKVFRYDDGWRDSLHEFWCDPFSGLRIRLQEEIAIVSDFIENLYEVDEYIKILDDAVEGKYLDFELEYNAAVVNSNSPWKWR